MKLRRQITLSLLTLVIVTGCASTQVSNQRILVNERLPRADRRFAFLIDFLGSDGSLRLRLQRPDATLRICAQR